MQILVCVFFLVFPRLEWEKFPLTFRRFIFASGVGTRGSCYGILMIVTSRE
jgi:hypothetical protein